MDISDSGLVRDGIMFALEAQPSVQDLKIAFIENNSPVSFVTCDDPVVMTNRLYCQKVRETNFGFGSAGCIFYLPLSPKVAMLLYDGGVYAPPKRSRYWIDCRSPNDVYCLNELIFVKAKRNIYFSSSEHFSIDAFSAVSGLRIKDWHRGKVLIEIAKDETGRTFVEADEPPPEGNYVIWTSQRHPVPENWPSILAFKHPPRAYSNGSGTGFVRQQTIPEGSTGFQRVTL